MRTLTLLALASLSTLPAANLPQITQQTVGIAQSLPLPRMAVPSSRQPHLSALHLAALAGDPEEVSQQLSAGANPNDRTTGYGNLTPLHLAANSPSRRAVQTLVGAGANLEARDTTLGTTPVFAAAANFDQLGAQTGSARPTTPPGKGQGGEPGESGTQYQKGQTASETREGVVLVIAYDSASDAFIGTVRNSNNRTVQHVRVEVHLSNGVELGPTPRVDLAAGETRTVNLSAESQSFTGFSVHVELGLGEHGGSGGEGGAEGNEGGSGEGSEGGREGRGEHGGGGESREGGGEHGGGGEGREGGGN